MLDREVIRMLLQDDSDLEFIGISQPETPKVRKNLNLTSARCTPLEPKGGGTEEKHAAHGHHVAGLNEKRQPRQLG